MNLKLCMQHLGLKFYKVHINDDPVMTLTYFTTRSNLASYDFKWEKIDYINLKSFKVIYSFL